jgi:hypothetical protein
MDKVKKLEDPISYTSLLAYSKELAHSEQLSALYLNCEIPNYK